jgi:hypothetical protein
MVTSKNIEFVKSLETRGIERLDIVDIEYLIIAGNINPVRTPVDKLCFYMETIGLQHLNFEHSPDYCEP